MYKKKITPLNYINDNLKKITIYIRLFIIQHVFIKTSIHFLYHTVGKIRFLL